MELPDRKSHKLDRSILKFKEDLSELKENHEVISSQILNLATELIDSTEREKKIEVMENLEDLNYEMDNNILMNLEMTFESIGGFEIKLLDANYYILSIKEEQDLLKHLEMSAKNLIKTMTVNDTTLSNKEKENLNYLYTSYKKSVNKTQSGLQEVCNTLEKSFLKAKKMEDI